jgi:hypothetical protein
MLQTVLQFVSFAVPSVSSPKEGISGNTGPLRFAEKRRRRSGKVFNRFSGFARVNGELHFSFSSHFFYLF